MNGAHSCWQVLGLPPGSDRVSIKKAYAALLKRTRPDDDAQAYQALRQAYEAALALASMQAAPDEAASPWHAEPPASAPTHGPSAAHKWPDDPQASAQAHPSPPQLAEQLRSALAQDGDAHALHSAWQHTAQALDTLPLDWQPWTSAVFAQLMLDTQAHMPDWLALALLQRFDWLNDFRAQQGLSLAQQEALHALLAPLAQQAQHDALVRTPAFQTANAELIGYARLVRQASHWRLWLYALLAGDVLYGQWQRVVHMPSVMAALGLLRPHTLALRAQNMLELTLVLRIGVVLVFWYLIQALSPQPLSGHNLVQSMLLLPAWLVGAALLVALSSHLSGFVLRLHGLRQRLGIWDEGRSARTSTRVALACLWVAAALTLLAESLSVGHALTVWPGLRGDSGMLRSAMGLALLGLLLLPPMVTPPGQVPVPLLLSLMLWVLCLCIVVPLLEAWIPLLLMTSLVWWLSCTALSSTRAGHWLLAPQPCPWREGLRWALLLGPAWPYALLNMGWRQTAWPPMAIAGTALVLAWRLDCPACLLPLSWLVAALYVALQHLGVRLAARMAS